MSLRRVIIATKKAPDAIGPYNQAVQVSEENDNNQQLIGTFRSATLSTSPDR